MRITLVFLLIIGFLGKAQGPAKDNYSSRYFEDQFYLGVSYNFVLNTPADFNQRNLSYGLQAGVIKDIPLNVSATRAIGIGLGLALNSYYSNLVVEELSNGFTYRIENDNRLFSRSKLETQLIEFPLEFRWRNSSAEEFKFWRIYGGIKAAYIIGTRSKLVTPDGKFGFYNTDINRLQYGLTLSFGYNTFNLNAYYGLSDLFGNMASVNGSEIGFKPLRIGFIFYIL